MNHRKFGVSSTKEKEVCRALGATGVMKVEDVKKYFGADTLEILQEKRMVKILNTISVNSSKAVIHLSEKGRAYTRKHLVYGSLYSWNRMQLKHDLSLNKIYLSLTKEERRSWRNESQIRKYSEGKVRGVDGCYIRKDGKKVAVEIVTKNYPPGKLHEKIITVNENFDDVDVRFAE